VLSQRYDNAQQTRLSHCPVDLENLIEAFEDLKAGGTTILMVEQNVRFAERPGDTVMDNGVSCTRAAWNICLR
jgi:ABC-type branched-subunit amino acid transport system ATPase component